MKKNPIKEAIRKLVKETLKENNPSISPTKPGPSIAPGKPGEKKGPRRPIQKPNIKPKPKAVSEEKTIDKIPKIEIYIQEIK
jgi:hypothetical protein